MKILLLAPEPFYQDRGTPIAINILLRALSERGDQIDVLTYHEGRDVRFQNVTLHRIANLRFVRDVRPGFSWKKIICDLLMLFESARLIRNNRYDLIFAVEESVFIALVWKWISKIPYVYDMDSSLVEQMLDTYPLLRPFTFLFKFYEQLAVKNALGIAPACQALSAIVLAYKPKKVVVLQDVSVFPD
jgi:hypothetical protein